MKTTPWHNKEGLLDFPYRALHDRVFIFPELPREKFGRESIIEVPKIYQQYYTTGMGIILSVGPGYQSMDGVWHATDLRLKPGVRILFNKNIPWNTSLKALDGRVYKIIYCGVQDIWLVDEEN